MVPSLSAVGCRLDATTAGVPADREQLPSFRPAFPIFYANNSDHRVDVDVDGGGDRDGETC
jgi:hypothetical protein